MTEKSIETKLITAIKNAGGLALKFLPFSYTGLPDRIVLLPGGQIYFVELKSPGRKPEKRQKAVHRMLKSMGFPVWVIDRAEVLMTFLSEVLP